MNESPKVRIRREPTGFSCACSEEPRNPREFELTVLFLSKATTRLSRVAEPGLGLNASVEDCSLWRRKKLNRHAASSVHAGPQGSPTIRQKPLSLHNTPRAVESRKISTLRQ